MQEIQKIFMKTKILIAVALSIIVLSTGCHYDVEEKLYGTPACDTSNITYSITISGIISTYSCLTCHSGPTPSGSFNLDSYFNVKAKVDDGRLFGAINHSAGFIFMPQNAPKMSQCDIAKVKAWIDAGAPNN